MAKKTRKPGRPKRLKSFDPRPQVASAKCDWLVAGADYQLVIDRRGRGLQFQSHGPGSNLEAASAKCDWRLGAEQLWESSRRGTTSKTSELTRRNIKVASAKCDARVMSTNFNAHFAPSGSIRELEGWVANTRMAIASSKCDWAVNLREVNVNPANDPIIAARLASSKCDYRMEVEFGLQGGPRYRLGAAASAKCDFRLIEASFSPNLKSTPVPIEPPKPIGRKK